MALFIVKGVTHIAVTVMRDRTVYYYQRADRGAKWHDFKLLIILNNIRIWTQNCSTDPTVAYPQWDDEAWKKRNMNHAQEIAHFFTKKLSFQVFIQIVYINIYDRYFTLKI